MLTIEDVRKISRLAKIKLTASEEEKFVKPLSEALDYVNVLGELSVSDVRSTSQVTGVENVWEADTPAESLSQEKAISNAKEKVNGFISTSQVITKDDFEI